MNLLQGTLDLLILRTLAQQELHGLDISHRISQVKPGSLFPALHRMQEAGWLASTWGESGSKRRAKFYRLTASGRQRLPTETRQWNTIATAVATALEAG